MAQENRENSVLFSLRELRDIEQTRVRDEEEERLQQQASERQRIEDEKRRVEEERLRVEREEQMRVEEAERRRREEELRLQEAAQREQLAAQHRLEQQRLEAEMQLRRDEIAKKRPTWLIGVAGALLVAGCVAAFFGYRSYEENQQTKAELLEAQKAAEDARQELLALTAEIERMEQSIDEAEKRLASAATAEEREAVQKELTDLREQASQKKAARKRVRKTVDDSKSGPRKINISEACRKNPLDC
ncbi:hypothetical protein [Haliangium ochraceum]|nr:hypothetical protein [Haliangium ochraceum]